MAAQPHCVRSSHAHTPATPPLSDRLYAVLDLLLSLRDALESGATDRAGELLGQAYGETLALACDAEDSEAGHE